MICKKCQQELLEDSRFCPYCGEPVNEAASEEVPAVDEAPAVEEAPAQELPMEEAPQEELPEEEVTEEIPAKKKPKLWVLILAIVAGVLAFAVIACTVLYFVLTDLGINVKFWENNIHSQAVYSVTDEIATEKADKVVATIGDEELTNGELQIYYWETVYNFLNQNYYYLSMYGLDTAKPLDQQTYIGDESMTWQQFFLEQALETWQRYTTLQLLSKEAGYELDEETKKLLEEFPTTLQETVAAGGFDTVEAWLEENCGPGVTEAGYTAYVHAYYEGLSYLYSRYEDLEPTDEEIEKYFTENEATFKESGVTREGLSYDVRHILIEAEGGTEGENGQKEFTEAEYEACRIKAQAILDQYLAGDCTEESFAALATANSADGGSSANGGLYTDLTTETNFVPEFKDWYLDESRKPGDTGLVKSSYGYHIMYFSASREIWRSTAAEQLLGERISDMIDSGMEQHPMKVNYKKIILGTKESL